MEVDHLLVERNVGEDWNNDPYNMKIYSDTVGRLQRCFGSSTNRNGSGWTLKRTTVSFGDLMSCFSLSYSSNNGLHSIIHN